MTAHSSRNRLLYILAMVAVIALGLLWRSHFLPLSIFAKKYGGDALWALLVYLGFAFIFARSSIFRIALAALVFAWTIEFSQLYHAPWIDSLRATRLGNLILGSTFNSPDLIAYAFGIGFASLAERFLLKTKEK